jgi:hypothetical protein
MPQIMNTYFKPFFNQLTPPSTGHLILPFGNEVEARAEAMSLLDFHDLPALIETSLPLHIVSEDESELLSFGPPGKPFRRGLTPRNDGPTTRYL